MRKKIINTLLFFLVFAGVTVLTVYASRGQKDVLLYNFIFLGVTVIVYLVALFGGMFRMNNLTAAFNRASDELTSIFKARGKTDPKNLSYLSELFDDRYLDKKMDNFTASISKSEEGLGDIEEYINDDDLDSHIHKRLLEMVPDLFTSLGILGTFVGLVWGLKNFEPTNYEAMTSSVSALVDGIKVAFLTSIYGISFSIVYSYGMKSEYSALMSALSNFLEKFHGYVMPTAENESRNLLLSNQKQQAQALGEMAEQFSVQMADSFEKILSPTFHKMNDSLDALSTSVTKCQEEAVKSILDEFMKQMHSSFAAEFRDFGRAMNEMKQAQKENTAYTSALYQTMSQKLAQSFDEQERSMKSMVTELVGVQNQYLTTANQIVKENQSIQRMQQQDYQHVVDYLRDAEKSASKFWVACNQAMQRYVESAAAGMERANKSNAASTELLDANRKLVNEFNAKLADFEQYQRLSYKTMEQVRRLLSDISVASSQEVYLAGGANSSRESMDRLEQILSQQAADQQALLEEMSKNIKELSKSTQKSKRGFFK